MDKPVSFYGGMTGRRKSFNPGYVNSGAGALRIFIVLVGIVAIILASVGSPSDTGSLNSLPETNSEKYYGYGTGYDVEPFNVVFIVTIVVVWIVSLVFLLTLGFEATHGWAAKANRVLHLVCGLILLAAIGCGCMGTYYFWRGCCRVKIPNTRVPGNIVTLAPSTDGKGYPTWCRCIVTHNGDVEGQTITKEVFTYDNSLLSGKILYSAWPHHFMIHCASLVLAFLDAILCLIAVCVV